MDRGTLNVERAVAEFDFEKLRVYQRAREFVNEVFTVSDALPGRVQYSLGDQIRRAALSIVNNVAEGSDRRSRRERAQFYRIALGSARECVPMLTIAQDQALITPPTHEKLRMECFDLCRMLRGLVNSVTD